VQQIDCTTLGVGRIYTKVREKVGGFDVMLVLGDRLELLPACTAATHAGVPIAHIHGGETTRGSYDNQIRHAVTKLSHIHYVATRQAGDRVAALGEIPENILDMGAPGLDNVDKVMSDSVRNTSKYFVLTFHPETLGNSDVAPLLKALDQFPDYSVYWTGVNRDPGWEGISSAIYAWGKALAPPEGGMWAYLRLARDACLLIGNSSSSIIEGPSLLTPAVDVGTRQELRERGPSVFHAPMKTPDIVNAIKFALSFPTEGKYWENPYGPVGASNRISKHLSEVDLTNIRIKP